MSNITLGMEDRDDFPKDEGNGDKNRRQDDAGNGEDDLNIRLNSRSGLRSTDRSSPCGRRS